jgi:hypothetical protein
MSPALWGPPAGRREHRVLWHGERTGGRAGDGEPHPALLAITVAEVLTGADELQRLHPQGVAGLRPQP